MEFEKLNVKIFFINIYEKILQKDNIKFNYNIMKLVMICYVLTVKPNERNFMSCVEKFLSRNFCYIWFHTKMQFVPHDDAK
jgi:hypothetical protein